MAEIYGHRWTAAYGENPDDGAAETWAKGLASVTPAQIAAGLNACIASADPWPPTLPEFRCRCLGIPTLAAVRALLRDEESLKPPFVVLMFQHVDYYNFRLADQRAADRMLADAYEVAREHVMLGGDLPDPPAALVAEEKQPRKPATPEVAAAVLAQAREAFGPPPPTGKDAAAGPDQ